MSSGVAWPTILAVVAALDLAAVLLGVVALVPRAWQLDRPRLALAANLASYAAAVLAFLATVSSLVRYAMCECPDGTVSDRCLHMLVAIVGVLSVGVGVAVAGFVVLRRGELRGTERELADLVAGLVDLAHPAPGRWSDLRPMAWVGTTPDAAGITPAPAGLRLAPATDLVLRGARSDPSVGAPDGSPAVADGSPTSRADGVERRAAGPDAGAAGSGLRCRAASLRRGRPVPVIRVPSPIVLACAVRSPSRYIVVTSALVELLTPEQLAAVVAHEHCHLRGRHHALTEAAAIAAPLLPSPVRAHHLGRVRLLTELAADDHAARCTSPMTVADGLDATAALRPTPGVAERATRQRVRGRRGRPARCRTADSPAAD